MSEEIDFSEKVVVDSEDEHKKQEYSKGIEQFNDPFLSDRFQKVADLLKLKKPTPVQSFVWKPVLSGEDVVTKSKTGSGKTLGFLLPIFEKVLALKEKSKTNGSQILMPYALIVTPTRELAYQIYSLSMKLYHIYHIEIKIVTGGVDKEKMNEQFKNSSCDVLIATPGRLIDLVEGKQISLENIHIMTFDEADKMLDMGFKPQLQQIYEFIHQNQIELQILFFSATYQENIKELVKEWCDSNKLVFVSINPPTIMSSVNSELSICTDIIQDIHVCAEHKKTRKLMDFLRYVLEQDKQSGQRQHSLICIFVNTIKNAINVHKFIKEKWLQGSSSQKQNETNTKIKPLKVDLLHGQLSQQLRNKILANFRCGYIQVLVTTDVFGRGMDIPHLNYILNYDFPSNLTTYIHRIGRTGRKGQKGYSRSFLTPRFYALIPDLEQLLIASNQKVPPMVHTIAEEQRIMREYNQWEQEYDNQKKLKEETSESVSPIEKTEVKPVVSVKRPAQEETVVRPKKVPLVPNKKRKTK